MLETNNELKAQIEHEKKSAVLFPSLGRTFKNYDRREIGKVYRFVVGQTDITSTMERLKTDTPSEMS